MTSLFRLFYGHALKAWGFYIVGSIFSIFVLNRFGIDFGPIFFGIFMCGYLLIILQVAQLFPSNLPWIMALPLSKKKILFLNYILNLTLIATFVISFFSIITIAVFIKTGHVEFLQSFFKHLSEHVNELTSWAHEGYVSFASSVCLTYCFIHAVSMTKPDPLTASVKRANFKYSYSPKKRFIFYLSCFVCLVLSISFYKRYFSGFSFVVIVCTILMTSSAIMSSSALSLSKAASKKLISISLGIVFIQVCFLYFGSLFTARDMSNPNRVASIIFLGPFGQGVSRTDLAKLLETDLNEADFSKLIDVYLDHFTNHWRVLKTQDSFLNFEAIVNSKTSVPSVLKVMTLFDPSNLDFDDLNTYFNKLSGLDFSTSSELFFSSLLPTNITNQEMIEFLNSKNENSFTYALLKIRYQRNAAFIPIIQQNITDYKDSIRLSGLKTLSLLVGRYLGLDDWNAIKSGLSFERPRHHSTNQSNQKDTFYETDCDDFKPTSIEEIEGSDIPNLNICIRKKLALTKTAPIQELETIGWLDIPFNADQTSFIQRIYSIH